MAKILITGGCGFLGRFLVSKWYQKHDLVVFNRDENKQFYLKQKYPNVKYVLGDIRDYGKLKSAANGCDHAVFAASMKHIDMCSENPIEASEIILNGAINSRLVAEECGMKSACFIGTDKMHSPSTNYGALKMAGSEVFISKSETDTYLNSLSYGNVFSSSGSILLKLNDFVKEGREIILFSEEMTRFGMLVEDALRLIEIALFREVNNSTIVPKLWSYRVKDIFEIYKEKFGLKYKIGIPRYSEKIHEIMIPEHSVNRTYYCEENDVYVIGNKFYGNDFFNGGDYSSKDYCVSKSELEDFLVKHNFFRDA